MIRFSNSMCTHSSTKQRHAMIRFSDSLYTHSEHHAQAMHINNAPLHSSAGRRQPRVGRRAALRKPADSGDAAVRCYVCAQVGQRRIA